MAEQREKKKSPAANKSRAKVTRKRRKRVADPSFADLAASQKIKPTKNAVELSGGFPSEENIDQFLDEIYKARTQEVSTPTSVDAVLLDTDVFSYLGRPGDTRATLYRPHIDGKLLGVSFITVGEILFGAYRNKWGSAKLEQIKARLRAVTIVPQDWAVCQTYGELKARLQDAGKPVADNDLWIAACAVRHSIPLVSHNRAHFENIPGLVLISEAPVGKF